MRDGGAQAFRARAIRALTNATGVYALVDLDGDPLYVGQSVDGIRSRVRRHLTSARSDIIANRQIDPWEVAEVWAWPTPLDQIAALEAALFSHYDAAKPLVNGYAPHDVRAARVIPPPQRVAILSDDERRRRLIPAERLPRQSQHYHHLLDYILVVKRAPHLRRSLDAHFERMRRYHEHMMGRANS